MKHLESEGWSAAVRNSGGAAVPLDEGVVNISLIMPKRDVHSFHFHDDFEKMYALIRAALAGTGQQVDWGRAADVAARARVILAGGLTPQNVADAIARVRPYGVDVSSGVEESPGVKDFVKVSRFLANARAAFAGSAGRLVEDR